MKNVIYYLLTLFILTSIMQAEIQTEKIEYNDGSATLEGYVVWDYNQFDLAQKARPAVILIHDWMGVGEFTLDRAKMIAELGYVAFVADIYGKGIRPSNGKEAGEQAGKYKGNIKLYRSRVNAALEWINNNRVDVDKNKIAAIGFCFGGTGVLELARSGADIKGVVSFHGGLAYTDINDAKNIHCKVLVLHGADDPFVKDEEVVNFEKEMKSQKIDYQLVKYSNAVHAFTNPKAGNDNSKGAAYNEIADKRSWLAMKNFFTEIFGE